MWCYVILKIDLKIIGCEVRTQVGRQNACIGLLKRTTSDVTYRRLTSRNLTRVDQVLSSGLLAGMSQARTRLIDVKWTLSMTIDPNEPKRAFSCPLFFWSFQLYIEHYSVCATPKSVPIWGTAKLMAVSR